MSESKPEGEFGGADSIGGVKVGMLIIARTRDGQEWEPLTSDRVPRAIKDPDVIARMLEGEYAQVPGDPDGWWYMARTEGQVRKAAESLNWRTEL